MIEYMISRCPVVPNSGPVTFQSKGGTCPKFQWENQCSKHRRCCWNSLDLKSQNFIFRMFNNRKILRCEIKSLLNDFEDVKKRMFTLLFQKCPLRKLHEFLHFQGTCNGQKWGSPSNFTRALMSAFASLMSPRCIGRWLAVSNTESFGLKTCITKKCG